MGLIIGLLKLIFKLFIYTTILVALVLVIPNLPPYTKFSEIQLEQTLPRTGGLSYNGAINNAQKLFTDKLIGPEAFRLFNGELYTGLATGEVVKISPGGHITFVTKIGQPCTGLPQEHICGRPLGLDIDEKNKLLYVADSYHGIWKVDLKTDKKQLLVSPNVEIGGKQVKVFNGIALDNNGNFYWTHSSSEFDLKDGAMTCLSDPSGRLLHYNSAKNKSEVLLNDLWFANGVAISPDNQFVIVTESSKYQIIKYFINGPKKGKSEVFVSGLPGIPDNLRVLPDGSGVLAALYVAFDDEHPLISRSMAGTPMARKFLSRLTRLIEIPFEFLNEHYPHVIFEEIVYKIGHFSSLSSIMPQTSGFLQIDWNGNIVASYFNTDKSCGTSSDAIVYNDKLYIGSPHSPFIASVPVPPLLKKAFDASEGKSSSAAKEQEKKIPQSIADATTKRQPVKEEEIKVVKVKDLHNAGAPVKNTHASDATHKKIESNEKKNPEHTRDNKIDTGKAKPVKKETAAKTKPVESKPIQKEAETKPKPTETKPVVKEAEIKSKPVETKPVIKEAEIKTKPVIKEAEVKTKPVIKEAEVKTKPVIKEAEVKTKPLKKEPDNKPKPSEAKSVKKETETKSKPEAKPIIKEADPKMKPVETKPVKKESETKPKVVEKETIKQAEAKQKPNEEKLKKETDPKAKPVETKTTQAKAKPVKSKESVQRSDEKQKVDSEPVKVDAPTDQIIVQRYNNKNKDSSKNPSNDKQKDIPDQIPVTEDIPSDSIKPSKETLKVITKSGPVEIPNPN